MDRKKLEKAIRDTCTQCDVCSRSGPPAPSRKISLTHVNKNFNDEIQVDFLFVRIKGTIYCVIHFCDAGTAYYEGAVVKDRKSNTILNQFDQLWNHRHGAPNHISGVDEFTRAVLEKGFLNRGVILKPGPSKRHNKVGIVERRNGIIKKIVEELQMDNSNRHEDTEMIITKAIFLSNAFSGSSILSAFELARGYAPSLSGSGSRMVSDDMLQAHKQQAAIRALHRLLRSRTPKVIYQTAIKTGDTVLYFYNSTNNIEPKEWRQGTVEKIYDHYVELRSSAKGPPTRAAFEDIRLKPRQQLAEELMDSPLDDIEHEGEGHYGQTDTNNNHDSIPEMIEDDLMEHLRNNGPTTEQRATATAMFARQVNYVGQYDHSEETLDGKKLRSNDKAILSEIYKNIGSNLILSGLRASMGDR